MNHIHLENSRTHVIRALLCGGHLEFQNGRHQIFIYVISLLLVDVDT